MFQFVYALNICPFGGGGYLKTNMVISLQKCIFLKLRKKLIGIQVFKVFCYTYNKYILFLKLFHVTNTVHITMTCVYTTTVLYIIYNELVE